MITIIDYGLGNVNAFYNIYAELGVKVRIARTSDHLADAKKIILPGVGAFDWALSRLEASGMRPSLDDAVLGRQVPVLGVCVGMQIMADSSEEGRASGLGWIPGKVVLMKNKDINLDFRLPHMGWNDVKTLSRDCLFKDIQDPKFYFLHSFHMEPSAEATKLATVDYGGVSVCAVRNKHIYGTQFHPEKSHRFGVHVLKNFLKL